MNKILSFTLCVILILSLLCSCSKKQYSDTLDCSYIASELKNEVSGGQDYIPYSTEDIAFMLDDTENFDSYCVVYSSSSDDIGEIGVFHAVSEQDSTELLDDVIDYLSDIREEKSSFVRNYLPDEQAKIDGATARRFGNYVVFTILEPSERDAVFNKAEALLK